MRIYSAYIAFTVEISLLFLKQSFAVHDAEQKLHIKHELNTLPGGNHNTY